MGGIWRINGIQLSSIILMIQLLGYQGCFALNSEGSSLLIFRNGVVGDPHGSFANWNANDADPCMWLGVYCLDSQVHALNLSGFSLKGELAPEIGDLTHIRSIVLSNNQFSGVIPKKLGLLTKLEVLDLSYNELNGTIPGELGDLKSLKRLFLSNNNFKGILPPGISTLSFLSELQFDENLVPVETCLANRKLGHGYKIQPVQTTVSSARRRLAEQSSNLVALPPVKQAQVIALPSSRSSGTFPAVPKDLPPPPAQDSPNTSIAWPTNNYQSKDNLPGKTWKYIIGISSGVVLIIVSVLMLIICKSRAVKTISPWATGLSGQLQKAFVTGVPKLNRVELEQACEDFSNIIATFEAFTVYKGTLSSGVEIAVISTALTSSSEWTKRSEMAFRKKIDTLSRVNHKNFGNLIGYCEEDEPFARMMVFEYAPNGSLFEHLHDKEVEHLDWSSRMRIIMGTAYCLQHMHELNPPVPHSNLNSDAIYMTDDYAAKVAEISFWSEFMYNSKKRRDSNHSEHSALPPLSDVETNIYSFGLLLLEIISGKLPYSEEDGSLLTWAAQYLNDREKISSLVDPTLQSFKEIELEVICEVIKECTQPDERKRPTMQETISRLGQVLDIRPESAAPRLSPLWWAELEILSAEAP